VSSCPVLDKIGISVSRAPALPRLAISKRVLIVEDECLVAMVTADQIVALGYTVVGPACTMAEARHLAEIAAIDAALLDLNLNGVLSHEIADILSRRNIPFTFITGHNGPPTGPYGEVDVLYKPFHLLDLAHAIEGLLMKLSVDHRPTAAQRS
jgi:chemotaxis family two-component system sensor kinase Cph1